MAIIRQGYATLSAFPPTGLANIIYVDLSTGIEYIYTTTYILFTPTKASLLEGVKSASWFATNPNYLLGKGQRANLDTQQGIYKLGDGVTALSALPFLGAVLSSNLTTEKKTANHIVTNADKDKIIAMDLAVANTITIRLNSVNPVDIGAQILIQQFNDGQITYIAESGVIINSKNGSSKSNGKFSFQSLIKIDVDEYDLTGDLEFDNSIEIINNIASYALVLSDANKLIKQNVATANNLTIPLNATVAFPIGTQILIGQSGAGQITFVPILGVTVNSKNGYLKSNGQHSFQSLIKVGADEWDLMGDLAA